MRFRLSTLSDLRQAQHHLHPGFKCSSQVWSSMPGMWETELHGPHYQTFLERAGFRLLTDYSNYYDRLGTRPASDEAPIVVGALRDSVELGGNLSHFFMYREPRLALSPMEQDVLLHALFNESDDEIATALGASLDTVHKHWRSAYQRVVDRAPSIFPADVADESGVRGREKRRHLLGYVRIHEELRP